MNTPAIIEITREHNPFPRDGIRTGEDGIPRYQDLPGSLLEMLKAQVDARPDAEALVELGGRRLTYRQLWDAAARVAGGLQAAGSSRATGWRALPGRDELGAGVLGDSAGGRDHGRGQHTLGTARNRVRAHRLGRDHRPGPGHSAARRGPVSSRARARST